MTRQSQRHGHAWSIPELTFRSLPTPRLKYERNTSWQEMNSIHHCDVFVRFVRPSNVPGRVPRSRGAREQPGEKSQISRGALGCFSGRRIHQTSREQCWDHGIFVCHIPGTYISEEIFYCYIITIIAIPYTPCYFLVTIEKAMLLAIYFQIIASLWQKLKLFYAT